MKVGLVLPQIGPTAGVGMIVGVAQEAEAVGVDSLWVTDRLLYPLAPQTPYPGAPDGALPTAYTRVYDPLTVLAFVAAYTTRVTLGTCVLNIPFYAPALLARQLATIDAVSAGRLRVGLGLGWSRDEFTAVGATMHQRGRRCEEFVQVLNTVWTEEIVAFDGVFYTIPPSVMEPKPVQQPRPPIYQASFVDAGLARVARVADGWMITGVPLSHLATMIGQLHQHLDQAQRNPREVQVIARVQVQFTAQMVRGDRPLGTGCPEQVVEDLQQLAALGVHETILDPTFTDQGQCPTGWRGVVEWVRQYAPALSESSVVAHEPFVVLPVLDRRNQQICRVSKGWSSDACG